MSEELFKIAESTVLGRLNNINSALGEEGQIRLELAQAFEQAGFPILMETFPTITFGQSPFVVSIPSEKGDGLSTYNASIVQTPFGIEYKNIYIPIEDLVKHSVFPDDKARLAIPEIQAPFVDAMALCLAIDAVATFVADDKGTNVSIRQAVAEQFVEVRGPNDLVSQIVAGSPALTNTLTEILKPALTGNQE